MNETAIAGENDSLQSRLDTKYGANAVAFGDNLYRDFRIQLPLAIEQPNNHKWVAGTIILACSGAWLVGSLIYRAAGQTMPWAIALGGAGLVTLFWLAKRNNERRVYIFKLGENRSFVISDGFAVSLSAATVLLSTLLWFYFCTPHPVRTVTRQVVDIELVSLADAVNRNDILPGTVKKADEQKKVQSNAQQTQAGKTFVQSPANSVQKEAPEAPQAEAQKLEAPQPQSKGTQSLTRNTLAQTQTKQLQQSPAKSEPTTGKTPTAKSTPANAKAQPVAKIANIGTKPIAITDKTATPSPIVSSAQSSKSTKVATVPTNAPQSATERIAAGFPNQLPSKWQTKTLTSFRPRAASRGVAAFEEVAPPEMVEMTDTEGENRAQELYQSGGRSAGGKGAKNNMSLYLKELHRRIKRAWRPPGGESRTAEILFRLKRTGQLASMKLTRSSGNNELDDAAMVAIAGCAPFKTLPQEYPSDYLDLLYTFNYSVDSLAEANKPQVQ